VDHSPVLRDHGYHPLQVTQVVHETAEASSFVLAVPPELRAIFGYRPGQFCTFRVRIGDETHLRSYSMSSAPETDADLTVTVKRVPGGLVSNWLLDTVGVGTVLEATKPAGVFCPQPTGRPVLGFCGGSGVTPVLSIVKHVLATTQRPVRLLYANRDRASVIFDEVLAELVARHPDQLAVRHHLDADGGFLTTDEIAGFARGAPEADVYVCGPGPFMSTVESALRGIGIEAEQVFVERFLVEQQEKDAAAVAAGDASDAGGASGVTTGAPDADVAGADVAAAPGPDAESESIHGAEMPAEVTVILNGSTKVVRYHRGDTVLETARRGGLRPPFSCESGNCATCMAFVKEGRVEMRVNNALTPEETEEGWVLTCQGMPKGETVTVEYEAM
jgi:3-ketosteroid 9alpha-monooxygenase subunit B